MKTAMQILISSLEEGLKQDEIKVSPKELLQNLIWRCEGLLEKEKERLIEFANSFYDDCVMEGGSLNQSAEEHYNITFNINERCKTNL